MKLLQETNQKHIGIEIETNYISIPTTFIGINEKGLFLKMFSISQTRMLKVQLNQRHIGILLLKLTYKQFYFYFYSFNWGFNEEGLLLKFFAKNTIILISAVFVGPTG